MKSIFLGGAMLLACTSLAMAQETPPTPPAVAAAATTDAPATSPAPVPVSKSPETVTHAPTGAADGCELHIWPAERLNSITTGLLGGGLLDAAIHANRDSTNKTLMASALDSQSQLDALLTLDLRGLLKLTPGTTIVTHATPIERKTMNEVKARRADSKAKCYAELIVADLIYQKAAIYGRTLRTLFMVRDFGSDDRIDFQYKAWGGNGLKLFPPKPDEDAIAALDELVGVFKKNFVEYAANEAKAPRTPEKH